MSLSIEVAAGTDVGCVRDNNKDNSGYDRRHTLYYRFVREWVDGLPGRSPAGSLSALCWSILTGHAKAAIFREAPKHWRESPRVLTCGRAQFKLRMIHSFYRVREVQGVILQFRARPEDGAQGLSCGGLVVHRYSRPG